MTGGRLRETHAGLPAKGFSQRLKSNNLLLGVLFGDSLVVVSCCSIGPAAVHKYCTWTLQPLRPQSHIAALTKKTFSLQKEGHVSALSGSGLSAVFPAINHPLYLKPCIASSINFRSHPPSTTLERK